ncbi:hypothetical protein VTH82DRAFT_7171 [Thermothelomyces myriococcoides]
MSIGTSWSSVLVTLHQACHSLPAGEVDMAIMGGTGVILNLDSGTFRNARSRGYGWDRDVAALILKTLRTALRDENQVHGIIHGTVQNQDGADQCDLVVIRR